jgi:hypothetical protein
MEQRLAGMKEKEERTNMTAEVKNSKLDEILGRASRDKDFRQKIIDNPKEALKDEGLSDEELEAVAGGMRRGRPGSPNCSAKQCCETG